MKAEDLACEICENEIKGKSFSLSALDGSSRTLQVCAACAEGPITLYHAGIEVVVDRDDYLEANKERLFYAIEAAACALEDLGLKLEGIEISKCSDHANEPLDIE